MDVIITGITGIAAADVTVDVVTTTVVAVTATTVVAVTATTAVAVTATAADAATATTADAVTATAADAAITGDADAATTASTADSVRLTAPVMLQAIATATMKASVKVSGLQMETASCRLTTQSNGTVSATPVTDQ